MEVNNLYGLYEANQFDLVKASALNPRRMHLILFVTEKCDFRCTYCYEDFIRGRMSSETLEGVKSLISKRAPELDILEIGWFGGEPLLAFDIIEDISEHIVNLKSALQFEFKANISTNAWSLSMDKFSYLVSRGTNLFQITIDGTENGHDKTRVRAGGSGTYRKIWGHLKEISASKLDFEIIIRVHISNNNIDDIKDLQKLLVIDFGKDSRFKFHYVLLENYGLNASASVEEVSVDTRSDIIRGLYDFHEDLSNVQNHEGRPYACYAGFANSLAIRTDGKILKCTMAINSERNIIGELKSDGSLEIDQDKYKKWLLPLLAGDQAGMACPIATVFK